MKIWENAEIVEMNLANTQYGGEPSLVFDKTWTDDNGALVVNFES